MAKKTLIEDIELALPGMSFNDSVRSLRTIEREIDASALKPLKVFILRTYTVETIEPVLKLRLMLEGFEPSIEFGDYNALFTEALDPASPLYEFNPDMVLVMARIEELLPEFINGFGERKEDEWNELIRGSLEQMTSLVRKLEDGLSAQVLLQNITLGARPYWGVHEAQSPGGQTRLIEEFNQGLAAIAETSLKTFIWDFDGFVRSAGYRTIFDPKAWYTSKNPYRQAAYPAIAEDLMRYILSMSGSVKKCVVVDLDNTLWGGIAGEDGFDGIALGHDYPGSCFLDLQKGLLRLYRRGIILAINSKNNEEDALEIIDKHPYMLLRRKHFAAIRINWSDKVTNMRALAAELNIGLDSMIFLDDNPAECAMVKENCPGVEVVRIPEKPYLVPGVIERLNYIEKITLTAEDRQKGEHYRAQAQRKEAEKGFENLHDFLKSLETEVGIAPAAAFTIPRIAQLTQKTNQMNLTTRRYTEADIVALVEDPAHFVFSVSSRDRFGDHGIIGVFILKIDADSCFIDTFLLSCRVIGRGIEDSMAASIDGFARQHGLKKLKGEYIPTHRNKPAAGMYERLGFKKTSDTFFEIDLKESPLAPPSYIRLDGLDGAATK